MACLPAPMRTETPRSRPTVVQQNARNLKKDFDVVAVFSLFSQSITALGGAWQTTASSRQRKRYDFPMMMLRVLGTFDCAPDKKK